MIDLVMMAMAAGAVLVFALGIWIGLGMPGARRSKEARVWRSADRLRATWMNRVFFGTGTAPRRFDASRLLAPKGGRTEEPGDSEGKPKDEVVRFRR